MRMDGKVVVVTGAGRGNGRAIAERLAAEGAAVVLGDINTADLEAVVTARSPGQAARPSGATATSRKRPTSRR